METRKSPLTFLGGKRELLARTTGWSLMLSETLHSPQLFSLLHKIDVDLAESSRGSGCPFVEGRCIVLHIFASLVAALLVYLKNIVFV